MSNRDIYAKALEEHREIDSLVGDLLGKIHCEEPNQDPRELLGIVAHLTEHLQSHFKMEEEGGFMTPVLEERPHMESTVNGLKKEHEEILDQCEAIKQVLANCSASSDTIAGICETIKNLIKQLKRHEKVEDELLQTTFVNDIGTKD